MPKEILRERNVEVRRAMLERCRLERLLQEANAHRRHRHEYGTLWSLSLRREEPIMAAEATGLSTGRSYMLCLDPLANGGLRTAPAVVASAGAAGTARSP